MFEFTKEIRGQEPARNANEFCWDICKWKCTELIHEELIPAVSTFNERLKRSFGEATKRDIHSSKEIRHKKYNPGMQRNLANMAAL